MSDPRPIDTVRDWVGPVLFVHAHPDDETIATGALIAELAEAGVQVDLVTVTRGERGEVVPGSTTAAEGSAELIEHREGELRSAIAELGISRHCFLGDPPARSAQGDGRPRRYVDSGMRWIEPGLAGPAQDSDPRSLTAASVEEAAADLCAVIRQWRPRLLISYDQGGGYGHPDHVRAHQVSARAAAQSGLPFVQVGTEPASGLRLDLEVHRARVTRALRSYRSQLTVDGPDIVHVGGEREPITLSTVLIGP